MQICRDSTNPLENNWVEDDWKETYPTTLEIWRGWKWLSRPIYAFREATWADADINAYHNEPIPWPTT